MVLQLKSKVNLKTAVPLPETSSGSFSWSPDWTKPVQAIDINLLSSNSIGLKQRCLDLSVTVPGQIAESNDSSQRDTWS